MSKHTHLTFDDRLTIETSLREGLTFKEISVRILKDPSTISKEIRNHRRPFKRGTYNPCLFRNDCTHFKKACDPCTKSWEGKCKKCTALCYEHCPDFQEKICPKLSRPPYVCNGCGDRYRCKLQRQVYDAKQAQKEYEALRTESRQGFAVSREELQRLDDIISPLIRQGHSIHQICINNADLIMLDEKTIYNYIDAGLLSARNIDLPRKVRYRTRKER